MTEPAGCGTFCDLMLSMNQADVICYGATLLEHSNSCG
jgi:hypothetical protein